MTNKNPKDIVLGKNHILNKRYTLGKMIGEGGLSSVYDARDSYSDFFNDDRKLAIKIPSLKLLEKKDVAAFVYSEYSVLNSFSHENIVKAVDFGIDEQTEIPYIVMEKLEGDLLVNTPLHKITKDMKIRLAFSLFRALSYIHSKGIIHADINPTNIMISPSGDAKIFDFGISQNIITNKTFNLAYNKNNAFNPIYSAPEIIDGYVPTQKTDLFSLACVLYELYTNELPFKNSSLDLKETGLSRKQLLKLPLMQRSWFKKALDFNLDKRPKNIPMCVKIKYFTNRK